MKGSREARRDHCVLQEYSASLVGESGSGAGQLAHNDGKSDDLSIGRGDSIGSGPAARVQHIRQVWEEEWEVFAANLDSTMQVALTDHFDHWVVWAVRMV